MGELSREKIFISTTKPEFVEDVREYCSTTTCRGGIWWRSIESATNVSVVVFRVLRQLHLPAFEDFGELLHHHQDYYLQSFSQSWTKISDFIKSTIKTSLEILPSEKFCGFQLSKLFFYEYQFRSVKNLEKFLTGRFFLPF